jgi:hypothetical protein
MEFKTIKGFDQYRIYQDGHVYSCKRKIVLKQQNNMDGYKFVGLWNDGIQYIKYIHRLVAEHFIDNPDNKPEVDHIDRDKSNNMYWNLRWATRSENCRNTVEQKNNKLGEKYICFLKSRNRFIVDMRKHNTKVKYFKTLDEAVEFRNAICAMHDLVF